jgi:zinc protease
VARSAPDYRAGQVANQVLGGGYSSRLNDEIRIRRGLSYGAGSRYDTRRAGGVIALSAQTKPESAVEVAGLLREALARMAREPVPAAELDARKATLIGGLSRSIETTEGLAARVGLLAAGDVPLDEFRGEIGAVARVSAADVQAFASRHWTLDGARVVVAGEGAKITEALRRAVPDLRVVSAVGFEPERLAVGGR